MNNRELLMAAIERRRPEHVPYTYDARHESDLIFKKHLGLKENQSIAEYYKCNTFTSIWSAIGKGPSMPEREKRNKTNDPNVHIDIWGCRRELITAGEAKYFEIVNPPLANAETVADIEKYNWPKTEEVVFPDLPKNFNIQDWKKDKVTLDMSYICPFGTPWSMLGLEKMMLDVALNPALIEAVVAKVEEYTMGCLEIVLKKYPGAFDLIGSGDDYGTQLGLLMSKDMIDSFFMPSLKRHYDLGKKYGVKGYHHCCGAIFEMIPSFIDAGLDVLNPIQTSAVGMDPVKLKKEFGKHLCFHGAIDIQQTIVNGSPEDVRAEVRNRIDTLGPEGYILASSHTLQPDTPPANFVAMYEEAISYGKKACG